MKHTKALIEDGGHITPGPVGPVDCAATATVGHNGLATLARRDGKTLTALLERHESAIARYFDIGETTGATNLPRLNRPPSRWDGWMLTRFRML